MTQTQQTTVVAEMFISLVKFEMSMTGKTFDECKTIVKSELKKMGYM